MNAQKQAKIIKIITAITVACFSVLLIVLVYEFIKISNLNKKKNELQNNLNYYNEKIMEYTAENNYMTGNSSDKFLEDYAREKLGYGKDGEIKFN